MEKETSQIKRIIGEMERGESIYFDKTDSVNTIHSAIQRVKNESNGEKQFRTTTKVNCDRIMFESMMDGEPLIKVTRTS